MSYQSYMQEKMKLAHSRASRMSKTELLTSLIATVERSLQATWQLRAARKEIALLKAQLQTVKVQGFDGLADLFDEPKEEERPDTLTLSEYLELRNPQMSYQKRKDLVHSMKYSVASSIKPFGVKIRAGKGTNIYRVSDLDAYFNRLG